MSERKVTIRVLAHDFDTFAPDYEKYISFVVPTDFGKDSVTMYRHLLESAFEQLRQQMLADTLEVLRVDPK